MSGMRGLRISSGGCDPQSTITQKNTRRRASGDSSELTRIGAGDQLDQNAKAFHKRGLEKLDATYAALLRGQSVRLELLAWSPYEVEACMARFRFMGRARGAMRPSGTVCVAIASRDAHVPIACQEHMPPDQWEESSSRLPSAYRAQFRR